jgi:hypothetical protein
MQFFEKYVEINDERRDDMIDFIVQQVEKTGMFTPVLFFLETGTPLSFVFSQLMYGGAPLADIIVEKGQHTLQDYAQIFEDRNNLYLLIEALEKRQDEVVVEKEKEKLRLKRLKERKKAEKENSEEESGIKKWLKFPRKK